VPKDSAEAVRQELLAQGVLRKGVAIAREDDTIYLPVTTASIRHATVEWGFRETFMPIRSYKDIARVPSHLREALPTSFDIVGDVAIIRIPDVVQEYEAEISDAIVRANGSVKVVAADEGVKGPLRIRQLRVLAGPNRTETVHREYGLSYAVDVARAYFSPRLGSERMRVAEQVRPGEIVVDMFSGVGPYAILLAKHREPAVVHAFDANPDAFRYLEENVRRNRTERVKPRFGNAIELVKEIPQVDRAIIDYPQDPDPAYRAILPRMLPNGSVHYYAILESADREERENLLRETAGALDREAEVLRRREVHGWSPTQKLYAFDIGVV
jgi:tRNA (guanine37-N1)-methyltransferase